MKHVTRQLEQVRQVGRLMLWLQPMMEFIASIIVAGLVLGVVDYAFLLPGWLRLGLGLGVLLLAGLWLFRRLAYVAGFWPDLTTLALRAERLFPELKGELATGVEFSGNPGMYDDSPRMAAMANQAAADADQKAQGVPLTQLINRKPTLRYVGVGALAIAALAAVALAAPDATWLATQRWLAPFGSAQWPKRTHVVNSMTGVKVLPSDMAVSLRAQVDKGYKPNMRVEALYRFIDAQGVPGPMETVIMNDQSSLAGAGKTVKADAEGYGFERLIEPPAVRTGASADEAGAPGAIEFYFQTSDDQSLPQTIALVARPMVRGLTAKITPPAYALDSVGVQSIDMIRQAGQVATASALIGSNIHLDIELNKPIPTENATVEKLFPNLVIPAKLAAAGKPAQPARRVQVTLNLANLNSAAPQIGADFMVEATTESVVALVDENGLPSLSQRLYRFEAIADKPPTVSMVKPVTDETATPTAVIPVAGRGVDDYGMAWLKLMAAKTGDTATPAKLIKQVNGQMVTMDAAGDLDLSSFPALKPGDVIALTAIGQDTYSLPLPGQLKPDTHDPVVSTPRTIRIIDESTLVHELYNRVAEVRPPTMTAEMMQQTALKQTPAEALAPQQDITARLKAQSDLVQKLSDRAKANNVKDADINQLLKDVKDLLDKASTASDAASKDLNDAKDAKPNSSQQQQKASDAKNQQATADKAMNDVADMLNKNEAFAQTMSQMQQLAREHQDLANKTAKMAAQTLGKPMENLTPQEKQALADQSKQEQDLKNRADELVKKLQQNSAVSKDDTPQQKATADVMKEAAKIAQDKGLQQDMQKASQSISKNQMSEGSQSQSSAQQTMQQMMDAMKQQQARQREMLKLQMQKLAEALQKLIEQQKQQLATLQMAQDLAALIDPMMGLRRNTMSVTVDVKGSRGLESAAEDMNQAVTSQGGAITGLRSAGAAPAPVPVAPGAPAAGDGATVAKTGEASALKSLTSALDKVNKAQAQAKHDDDQKELDEKQKQYEALAARQNALRGEVAPLADKNELPRQEILALMDMAGKQAKIHADADELGATLADFPVFKHMHAWIDDQSGSVEDRLLAAKADSGVLSDQKDLADMFQRMADALKDAKKKNDDEFAKEQTGGGGGPGGGGPPPPKIPPTAQLKLLRSMQEVIYTQTNQIDKKLDGQPAEGQSRRTLMNLSTQERSIADLGAELLKAAQQGQNAPSNAAKELQ